MPMKPIEPNCLNMNAFTTIGTDWLLITAEKNGKVNTMTASWGGVGILWGKPVAYIFIRPQRYTKEFVDAGVTLSLSVLPEKFRGELMRFGTVSGRDEDKIALSGLEIAREQGVPYFAAAEKAFICRKLYAQELRADCFMDSACAEQWYPEQDYHTMYVVEIEKILVSESEGA